VPVATTATAPAVTALAERVGQNRRELRLSRADRLIAENEAALEEHLGQVA
jgi:hypothetical protein